MWQVLGPLAAIIGLAGLMLLRSRRPRSSYRERREDERLGVRISDDIQQRLLREADPLRDIPPMRLAITAAQLHERAARPRWWARWRR